MKTITILAVLFATMVVSGQNGQSGASNHSQNPEERRKQAQEDEFTKRNKQSGQPADTNLLKYYRNTDNNDPNLPNIRGISPSPPLRDIRHADKKERERLKNEAQAIINQINKEFAVPAEYLAKYNVLLSQKDTGIFRMFPDKNCGVGLVVTVEMLEKCANLPQVKGSGSRYSIRFNWIPIGIHPLWLSTLFNNTDMHFINDNLLVGNQMTLGIISEIGNIDLNQPNLKSDSVKFLLNLKAPTTLKKFNQQKDIFSKGISENGYSYASSAVVKTNSTYIFRSIAYSHTDLLFALQIVGKEEDGSIIFLWKKLKEKKSPIIKFE